MVTDSEVKELIYLETEQFTLTIKGAPVHPDLEKLYPDYASAEARLEINPINVELQEALHFSPEQNGLVEYSTSKVFPFFYEWQDYEVIIENKTDKELEFYHQNQQIRQSVTPLSRKQNILTGTINFRTDVGLSELKIRQDGFPLLNLTIEIFPSKIDYKTDYQNLLREVNQEVYNLAYDFLRRTFQELDLEEAENVSHSEFFAILEQIFSDFQQAFNRIKQMPHHQLKTKERVKPAGKVKQINRKSINWLKKNLQFYDQEQERPVKMLDMDKKTSFNTFENKFVKWMIAQIKSQLITFKEEYQQSIYGEADENLINKINELRDKLNFMLTRTFLNEVGELKKLNSLSLVLQMAPGYRELYKYYLMLKKGLSLNGEMFNLSLKETWQLYEYWCFLKLNQILREKYKLIKNNLIDVNYSGIYVTLNKSSKSRVEYQHPDTGEKFSLVYNSPEGSNITTGQQPDNVLSLEKEDSEVQYRFVFDAKYRINPAYEGTNYYKKYGIPGPEEETINTMHRYRDAIVQQTNSDFKRTMVGAYVLFPYHDQQEFKDHSFYQSIDQVNVGAFPFLPGSEELVAEFLAELIEESSVGSYERNVLPTGTKEYQAKMDFEQNVLVGSLGKKEQLSAVIEANFYHLPCENRELKVPELDYIAIYQSKKKFPQQYGVKYYAPIEKREVRKRKEIPFPSESDGEKLYYYFKLGAIKELANPIVPEGYGIIGSHIYTNYMLLKKADTLPELSIKTLEEWRVWLELKRMKSELEILIEESKLSSASQIKGFKLEGATVEVTEAEVLINQQSFKFKEFISRPRKMINNIFSN